MNPSTYCRLVAIGPVRSGTMDDHEHAEVPRPSYKYRELARRQFLRQRRDPETSSSAGPMEGQITHSKTRLHNHVSGRGKARPEYHYEGPLPREGGTHQWLCIVLSMFVPAISYLSQVRQLVIQNGVAHMGRPGRSPLRSLPPSPTTPLSSKAVERMNLVACSARSDH